MTMTPESVDRQFQTEKGILVIHEDPFHREMITLCLTRSGYVGVFVVENFQKGLELLSTVKPVIVVMSDGVLKSAEPDVGDRIRSAAGNSVKIIVIGDGRNTDSREKAKQINADDFAERSPDSLSHYAHLLRSISGLIR